MTCFTRDYLTLCLQLASCVSKLELTNQEVLITGRPHDERWALVTCQWPLRNPDRSLEWVNYQTPGRPTINRKWGQTPYVSTFAVARLKFGVNRQLIDETWVDLSNGRTTHPPPSSNLFTERWTLDRHRRQYTVLLKCHTWHMVHGMMVTRRLM